MLSAALGRNTGNRAFQDLQKRLLNALARNVSRDRNILGLSADLVDLVDIDDAVLGPFDIIVRCLNDLQQNVFNILAHIAGFCQRRRIGDGERNVQKSCQRLGKKRFTGTCGAQHQNVAFLQLHVQILCGADTLIVIVDSNRKGLFGIILANDVVVEDGVDLFRFQKIDVPVIQHFGIVFAKLFFEDLGTDPDAFVTDKRAVRTCDQLAYLIFGLLAEGAPDFGFFFLILWHFFWIF